MSTKLWALNFCLHFSSTNLNKTSTLPSVVTTCNIRVCDSVLAVAKFATDYYAQLLLLNLRISSFIALSVLNQLDQLFVFVNSAMAVRGSIRTDDIFQSSSSEERAAVSASCCRRLGCMARRVPCQGRTCLRHWVTWWLEAADLAVRRILSTGVSLMLAMQPTNPTPSCDHGRPPT